MARQARRPDARSQVIASFVPQLVVHGAVPGLGGLPHQQRLRLLLRREGVAQVGQ